MLQLSRSNMLNTFRTQSEITKAHIRMHLSVLLWGASGVLGKGIRLSEGLLVWYRMLIVAFSLGSYMLLTKKSFRVSKKQLFNLCVVGNVLMVHWLFFYGAIKYSNVSITLSVFSSTTLFTALIEPFAFKKKFNKVEFLYSVMAMCGIAIIFYSDENSYTLGIILALLASFVGAFFNILNKKLVNEVESEAVAFYEIFSGLIVLSIFLPFYIKIFQPEKLLPDVNDWMLLFVFAIFSTHIALILSLKALKHLSAFTLNLVINLEPVYGIALAFLIFGENKTLGAGFFAGTSLILLSVILHSYFAGKEKL